MKVLRNTIFLITLSVLILIPPLGIHEAIAATNTGMLVYGEDTQITPRYRLWDGSDLASSESSAITGELGHGESYFMDLVSSTTRVEKILVEQTENGHVRTMVWNGSTSTWSLGTGAPTNGDWATFTKNKPTARAYGIAYETDTGMPFWFMRIHPLQIGLLITPSGMAQPGLHQQQSITTPSVVEQEP